MSVLMSLILLMSVTNILGTTAGGIFSIAYANAQQFQVLGSFEMRAYQVTDIKESHPFGLYLSTRIVTCGFMLIGLALFATLSEGISTTAVLFFVIGLLRFLDAFEDVFHGLFQLRGRLDIGGKALFIRSLITAIAFILGLLVTSDLLYATLISIGCSICAIYICDIKPAANYSSIRPQFEFTSVLRLLTECFPIFLGSFMAAYLTNAPKYGLQHYLPVEYQAIFSIIFMPAMAVNLLCGFVFRPLLTDFARCLQQDANRFGKLVKKAVLLSAAVLIVVIGCAYAFGTPLLSALYGININSYKTELIILVIGGLFYAISTILYYALTTLRKQASLLVGYGITAAATYLSSGTLISAFGFRGAALLYDISMAMLVAIFYILYKKAMQDGSAKQ